MSKRNDFEIYTNEELVKMLQDISEKLGKTIGEKELVENGLPSRRFFYRRFNCKNWGEVMYLCGMTLSRIKLKFTKEQLIHMLQEASKQLGKSPTSNNISTIEGMPSSQYFYTFFKTNSWNEILNIAGLEYNHFEGYTDEYCLNQLKLYYQELGKIPTRDDFEANNWRPCHGMYAEKFESYENACYLAGIGDKPLTEQERIQISISELINLANKLNRCPTVEEFESIEDRGYSRRDLEKHLELKYNDICRKYIPQYEVNVNHDYTKEYMTNGLIRIYNTLGRAPMFEELADFNFNHDFNCIVKHFEADTYNGVIEELGWTPSYSTTKMKSKEQMLSEFKEYCEELQRIPYVEELNTNGKTATYTTYIKHFGNMENLCKLANIDFEKYYLPCLGFRITFDKNGDICRSLAELEISNFLIDNNIKYYKEVYYKELLPNQSDKRRFDWKIEHNDKSYYIEYAGLYDNGNKNIAKDYNDKIHKKIEDLVNHGVIDKCYFIYPENIKKRTLKDIFNNILGENTIN